ncbi:hypothetical protein IMCC3317_06110 [Kordia antarctica]|uniref:Uncharacterized protein n=1 Tax=Kordia antarctica TaxID=1218801 RepID=A0A7L4ZF83_9FLAO|nr:hypothetical protein [Kordia antarctica]QHI35265.1 hypothetical protein IMCC3317_06110 [Kordia antarctica]
MENSVPLIIVALLVGIAIGYFICKKLSENNNGNPDAKAPEGIIEVTDAVNLHENYVAKLNDPSQGTTTNPDFKETQFAWFSIEKIRNYIQYLDNVEKVNPENPEISGVRVYFGKYNQHKDYPNQQTVFFTPTVDTKLSEEYHNMKNLPFSIIPNDPSSPLVGRYKVITRLLLDEHNADTRANEANLSLGHKTSENLVQKSSAENDDDNGTSLSFNLGQLSPPPPRG